jgi:hypothetical protein
MTEPQDTKVATAEAKTDPAPPAPYVAPLRDRYLGLAPLAVEGSSRTSKRRR